MKQLQGLVLALSACVSMSAHAGSKEDIIRAALKKGAVIVVCDNGTCINTRTHEVVGAGPDGSYLTYPPGHEDEERRTAQLLAKAE